MTFDGRAAASVCWDEEVVGFAGLTQKAVNGVMTQLGSDAITPERGTDALKELVGHGAYDLMAIQHTLNFAAQKSFKDTSRYEGTKDPASQIKSLRMRLAGITQNVAQAVIVVQNRAGETTNDTIALA
jgi:hypothetical protein